MHNQKAHFVTSSVVTSPNRNLEIQIGPVLQFCMHCILQNITVSGYILLKEKLLGGLIFYIATRLVTIETLNAKYSWKHVLLLSETCL